MIQYKKKYSEKNLQKKNTYTRNAIINALDKK